MTQQANTPQFIKQAPWYAQANSNVKPNPETGVTSKKQLEEWYERGKRGFQSSSYRKGACENCGAMGHSRKQCTQRPRKIAAKFTSSNIAADDVTKDLKLDWESKRDRWNGYEAEMYKEVIKEHAQYEEIRKLKKLEEDADDVDKEYKASVDPLELASLPNKYQKNQKFQGLGGVRNREDTAKYLLNLDVNSDHFDPKSRAMKNYDNPDRQLDNLDMVGERDQFISQSNFAAEQVELHNSELNTFALPTLTEKIFKKVKQTSRHSNAAAKINDILSKYGESSGVGLIDVIEEEEQYFERAPKRSNIVRSRYEEDIFINDHTTVWGSWYNKLLGWGYACCHSTIKQSFCLGIKGKQKALALQLKKKAQILREMKELQQLEKDKEPQGQGQKKQEGDEKVKQGDNQGQAQQSKQEQAQEQQQK